MTPTLVVHRVYITASQLWFDVFVESKGPTPRMIVGKSTESRAAIVLRSSIQACIRRRFGGVAGCRWKNEVI